MRGDICPRGCVQPMRTLGQNGEAQDTPHIVLVFWMVKVGSSSKFLIAGSENGISPTVNVTEILMY